jgi:hypothetical protein
MHYVNIQIYTYIKIGLRETGWNGMHCIYLAQDRAQWRSLENMAANLGIVLNFEKSLSAKQLVASQEELIHLKRNYKFIYSKV